jgi:Glycosyl hydrolase family 26
MICKTALVGTAILVSSGWVTSLANGAESPILEPASGAWLGLYYGAGSVAQTSAKLGRSPRIHLTYYSWAADWTGNTTKADLAAGRIPLVNWEPAKIDFAKIADGSLDATILARANGAKALGKKFFLDFAAEMNGDEAWSGNNAPLYVSAYRHIHDLFVAAGATNVVWAWCPNVTDNDGGNRTTMDYYPGDAYVDWTGVDGYNWGTKNGGWQSFERVFQKIYPLLATKKKPILIGEMSSSQAGGDKAKWIDEIIPILRGSFPLIKGVVWFDIDKEADWRISSSPESERAFIRMMNDPYFNP